ncbi:MAG: adenylyltransferase/cytidyltransferase family protein, partial [Lachnospiraceae bacterium]|nr:adenylyltransferase/cytidyltransferase family protein [Candidatus Minthocola equi]
MNKIVVLFGSFNPLTNAHINVLKTAKAAVDADLGLFVATNGDYLRSKSVLKKHDCFYLTEDERKETIVKACEKENGLAFWGFELGGASPKRYKTLCKIKQEYPMAEIYEVEGADKVQTLVKFKVAEEYVGNTNFIIFERDDIDVKALIGSEPLLKKYADHFTVLPPVYGFSEVSSTEIRRRFYAGESYGNLLPQSSVDLLNSHTPADFELSFT